MTERIKIDGKVYKVPAIDDLSFDDILVLDAELQGRYGTSWVDVQQYVMWSQGKSEREIESHPMSTRMAGVTIWMVLRLSGKQDITMREALSIPPSAIEDVETAGPKDHLPKGSKKSRKASVQAVARPRPSSSSSQSTTSTDLSESA